MQTSWALFGARSKLRSKVMLFSFVPISRLNNFVRQCLETAKMWQVVNKPTPNKINTYFFKKPMRSKQEASCKRVNAVR